MSEKGLVSAIIPTYKRSTSLPRAINSVLGQTYRKVECVVINDNEIGDEYSQELYRVIEPYRNDSRFLFVEQEVHINGAVARNEGVKASHGEYIAFLDDDDEWLPSKIEEQMIIMLSDSTIDGVAGGATLWAGDKEVSQWIPKKTSEKKLQLKVLIREIRFATSTFLCKKSAYEEMGGFNPTLRRSQDLQLFADFLSNHRIYPMMDKKTTKMYIDSAINRLDSKKIAENKEEFFEAISSVMASYSDLEKRRIRSAHHYETAFVAIKEKKYLFAAKYLLLGFKSPSSLIDLYKRFKER